MANVIANAPSARIPAFGLYHDEWGQLVLIDADGVRHVGIIPQRMFPFSDPDKWLSLLDPRGHEIVCIENMSELSPAALEVLQIDLSRREFVPVITRIIRVSSILEPCDWVVETDRGRTQFVLKAEEDVRRLGPNQALVVDASGIRYLIRDFEKMDAASQTVLERYV
jgi:Domain of unknown function (DUF1854)